MIASHYIVEAKDFSGKVLGTTQVYSFDEAFYFIEKYREKFWDNAFTFTIKIPPECIIE